MEYKKVEIINKRHMQEIYTMEDVVMCCETLTKCFERLHWDVTQSGEKDLEGVFYFNNEDGKIYVNQLIIYYGLEVDDGSQVEMKFCPYCGTKINLKGC